MADRCTRDEGRRCGNGYSMERGGGAAVKGLEVQNSTGVKVRLGCSSGNNTGALSLDRTVSSVWADRRKLLARDIN